MKVILTAKVSKFGQIGEVVNVKNGYARNFLIPNKKAICFTPSNEKLFELKRSEFEQANQENLEAAQKIQNKLKGKDVVIIENASDDGRLYGSVSSGVIAAKINNIIGGKDVSRSNVFLKKPIKEIGVYHVKVDLHSDVNLDVRLIVTRSESEIEALLKADAKLNAQESAAKKKSKDSDNNESEDTSLDVAVEETEEAPKKRTRKKKAD